MSLFVTFEGVEGSGKTTQVALLADHLEKRGHTVVTTREPGGTRETREIRRMLSDPDNPLERTAELLLFLADRAQHVASVLRPALKRGDVVLCDRYSDSTMAYQGYGRCHNLDRVRELNQWASLDLVPDLTIWIDCDVETGLRRAIKKTGGPSDRFEAEPLEFHEHVRAGFVELHRSNPDRIVRIDGSLELEDITAMVIAEVERRLS
ncbi:MAG: dTMP kinase [Deltaproteobacteria bacterium]